MGDSAKKIAIIEDNEDQVSIYQRCFERAGYHVYIACNASEGKKVISSETPQVVLLDYDLPDLNGVAVLNWIVKNYPDTVVIIATAMGSEEIAAKMLKTGAYDYLIKPISTRNLLRVISSAFEHYQMELVKKENLKLNAYLASITQEWKQTFDAVPDMITLLDHNYKIKRANMAVSEFTGIPIKELIGQKCYDVFCKSSCPFETRSFQKAVISKKSFTAEIKNKEKQKVLLITENPVFDENDKIIGMIHISRDVTSPKKTEERLRQISLLAEASTNFIMRIERNEEISYINPATIKFLNNIGLSKNDVKQIIPRNLKQLTYDIPNIDKIIQNFEVVVKNRTLLYTIRSFADESWILLSGQDVTEIRKLEQEVRIREKQASLLTMMTGLTDLLNNKIMVVQGFFELFQKAVIENNHQRALPLSKEVKEHLAEISGILNSIYSFSQQKIVKPSPLSSDTIFKQLANSYKDFVKLSKIQAPKTYVYTDKESIKQLNNIIQNSIEANKNELEVLISSFIENDFYFVIEFKDNGHGISPENLEKATLPFFTTKGTSCHGVGLWKVFHSVTRFGGKLKMESEEGIGTTVKVYLRIADQEK